VVLFRRALSSWGVLFLYWFASFCGFVSLSFVFLGGTFPLLVRFLLWFCFVELCLLGRYFFFIGSLLFVVLFRRALSSWGVLFPYWFASFCGFVSSSFVFLEGTFPLLVRFLLFPMDELLFMSD